MPKTDQEEIKVDDAPILSEYGDDDEEEDDFRQIKPTKRHINLIERKQKKFNSTLTW